MIFLDTSGIYAAANANDPNHATVKDRLTAILDSSEGLLTHSYVLGESAALMQRRLGLEAAVRFAREARTLTIDWIDHATHEEAAHRWSRSGLRHLSLVDHVRFLVMRSRGIDTALAFDQDFVGQGFRLYA